MTLERETNLTFAACFITLAVMSLFVGVIS